MLYLEGNLPNKVTATLGTSLTVYSHRDFQTALGSLYAGQSLEIVGLSTEGYLVKTSFRNNTITGWIHVDDLPTGVDPSLFVEARKNQARRDTIAVAIANKNVIQGMTSEEVQQAVGKPEQVFSRTDATGTSLTWTYTTYRQEPQYSYTLDSFGRPTVQTYYVKVAVGQLAVDFTNGVVTSFAQHKTDPSSPGVVTN